MSYKLASYLREKLNERDWSVRHFARLLGISHTHANDIVNQEAKPSMELLRKMADILATPMEDLLRLYGVLPPRPAPGSEEAIRKQKADYYFSRLSPEQQQLILQTMEAWDEANREPDTNHDARPSTAIAG
jgi:transcriptional regulator with XRE-family HTH domain